MGMERHSSNTFNAKGGSMSDWATEEAARLSNLDRDTREESQWVCDQIASALRSAFQRGKDEAWTVAMQRLGVYEQLRAKRDPLGNDMHNGYDLANHGVEVMQHFLAALDPAKFAALEQENKD
jgi:hypothetical protein